MNAKDKILNALRKQSVTKYEMPDLNSLISKDTGSIEKFIQSCDLAGAKVIVLIEADKPLNKIVNDLYPDAEKIISNLTIEGLTTIMPDTYPDPHLYEGTDISILEGAFGVAENGAVWLEDQQQNRVVYFIPDNLILILPHTHIVATMHDAYSKTNGMDYDFGVFISGPSKTADIEQALVIGAHGAKSVTVILT